MRALPTTNDPMGVKRQRCHFTPDISARSTLVVSGQPLPDAVLPTAWGSGYEPRAPSEPTNVGTKPLLCVAALNCIPPLGLASLELLQFAFRTPHDFPAGLIPLIIVSKHDVDDPRAFAALRLDLEVIPDMLQVPFERPDQLAALGSNADLQTT